MLATILSLATKTNGHIVFATVFFSNIAGAVLVTLNGRFLGLNTGFFESMCTMGYCLAPLAAGAFLVVILSVLNSFTVKFFVVAGCYLWSCACKKKTNP